MRGDVLMMIDGNMIMSGVVSKFVNDIGDKLKNKIRNADENRKSSEQNIETRIYQVTIDALNVFTSDKYKGQEKLYDAAESILSGFKIKKENNEVVKTGMKILGEQLSDDRCADFFGKLRDEICKDENDNLYKEVVLMQNGQIIKDVHENFKRSDKNHEDLRKGIHEGFERSEQNHREAQRKLDYLVEKAVKKLVQALCHGSMPAHNFLFHQ